MGVEDIDVGTYFTPTERLKSAAIDVRGELDKLSNRIAAAGNHPQRQREVLEVA